MQGHFVAADFDKIHGMIFVQGIVVESGRKRPH